MANRFVLNTISYHGSGAIKEIPGELQRRGYKKIFVCSDPDLVKFGVTAKMTDELDADFCICLYNPRSRKRADRLSRAAKIMLEWKAPDTLCGWVRNIGREGQQSGMCRLSELGEFDADMFTTVFVGNADTKLVGGRMVTPRGYREIPCER